MKKIPIQTIFQELDEEGKIILELEAFTKTRTWQLRNRSISEYLMKCKNLPLKNLHGRMRILYKSIRSYSSVEDNTFLKERGMLGPYITTIVPYCYYCTLVTPFCYYCALKLLLLGQLGLHCGSLGLHYGHMDSDI